MSKIHTARKLIIQLIFQKESSNEKWETIIEHYINKRKSDEEMKKWAIKTAKDLFDKKEICDKKINTYAIEWELNRISKVDLAILRLAIYELLFTKTPYTIIANEAIELSKVFSTEEAPAFINGIIGQFIEKECLQD